MHVSVRILGCLTTVVTISHGLYFLFTFFFFHCDCFESGAVVVMRNRHVVDSRSFFLLRLINFTVMVD